MSPKFLEEAAKMRQEHCEIHDTEMAKIKSEYQKDLMLLIKGQENLRTENEKWQDACFKLTKEKDLAVKALEMAEYTLSGARSQMDLTSPREKANFTEVGKGLKIVRDALLQITERSPHD